MEKVLEIEEGKKIIEKFIELHRNNSTYYSNSFRRLKLDFSKDNHKDEEYFTIFKSVLINNFETNIKEEKLSEISLFIFCEYEQEDNYGYKKRLIKKMGLEDYLKLTKDSKFPFDYLSKLEEFKEKNKLLNLLFLEEEIIKFCSKYVYYRLKHDNYFIEIKKIEPKKYQYSYQGEKEKFDEIEKLWRERDYRSTLDECDTLLGHFIKNLYERKTGKEFSFTDGKKDQEIKEVLEEITFYCELPELKDSINNMIKEFNNMRNKLGKNKPPYKTELERWKKFNELPEIKKDLYTKMSIDLLKCLHNLLIILQRNWESVLDNG